MAELREFLESEDLTFQTLERAIDEGGMLAVCFDGRKNHRVVHILDAKDPEDGPTRSWAQEGTLGIALAKAAYNFERREWDEFEAKKLPGIHYHQSNIDRWIIKGNWFIAKRSGLAYHASASVFVDRGEVVNYLSDNFREAYESLDTLLVVPSYLLTAKDWRENGTPEEREQE